MASYTTILKLCASRETVKGSSTPSVFSFGGSLLHSHWLNQQVREHHELMTTVVPTCSLCFKLLGFLLPVGYSRTFFNLFQDPQQHPNKTFFSVKETEEHKGRASFQARRKTLTERSLASRSSFRRPTPAPTRALSIRGTPGPVVRRQAVTVAP